MKMSYMKDPGEVFDEEDDPEAEEPKHEGDELGDDGPGGLTDLQPAAQLEQVRDEHGRETVQAATHCAQSSAIREKIYLRKSIEARIY